MKSFLLIFLFFFTQVLFGQPQRIDNFLIKENLTSNGKIAIVATDSSDIAIDNINGSFTFSINGFQQLINFHDGVGVPQHTIESSTFAYIKHKNQEKSTSKVYFLYKKENSITPVKINGFLLLIIPAIILLIAYAAKRLLTTFIILGIVYGYFSFSKGFSISQLLENLFDTVKNIF